MFAVFWKQSRRRERESLFLAADSLRLERFGRAHPVVVPDARAFSP